MPSPSRRRRRRVWRYVMRQFPKGSFTGPLKTWKPTPRLRREWKRKDAAT